MMTIKIPTLLIIAILSITTLLYISTQQNTLISAHAFVNDYNNIDINLNTRQQQKHFQQLHHQSGFAHNTLTAQEYHALSDASPPQKLELLQTSPPSRTFTWNDELCDPVLLRAKSISHWSDPTDSIDILCTQIFTKPAIAFPSPRACEQFYYGFACHLTVLAHSGWFIPTRDSSGDTIILYSAPKDTAFHPLDSANNPYDFNVTADLELIPPFDTTLLIV